MSWHDNAFTGIFSHDRVRQFLGAVAPPWLLKPRSQASAAGIRKLHEAADVWKEIERLGDEQSFDLEPNTGVSRFHYAHHNTTNEVEAKLVSFSKGSAAMANPPR